MVKVKKAGANIDSLRREATCLAMLQHPHIVSYYASYTFKKGKVFAIVTELLSGGSLLERMRAGASREELNRCVGELASALAHMHGLRVQHRDVKPENVLLDGTGSAKLIDVGLACILGSRSRVSTKAGGLGLVGTTLYMSPEKGSGKSYDAKDDVRGRASNCAGGKSFVSGEHAPAAAARLLRPGSPSSTGPHLRLTSAQVWALGLILAAGATGKPLEDSGLNTTGIFALNRAGVDQLVADARAAAPELGALVQSTLSVDPTDRPTARQLAERLLAQASREEGKVGAGVGAGLLAPPPQWEPMADPFELRLSELPVGLPEREDAIRRFRATLPSSVNVLSVARVQNLPLWQSYAVKRQTILMREKVAQDATDTRFERKCLFHGTGEAAIASICLMGFNRSWTTANATRYGKGTYFAREASYSYSRRHFHSVNEL